MTRQTVARATTRVAQKMLYHFIFDPSDKRLPELTDLPLLQIPVLDWMAVFDAVFKNSVEWVQYAVDLRKYEEYKRTGKGEKVKEPEKPALIVPSEEWRFWHYKHRRSLGGEGVMRAATLAAKQLEVQQEVPSADQLRSPTD